MSDGEVDVDGELPEGWRWDTIGGVAEVSGGLTKNAAKRDASKVRAPLVSVAAVHLRRIDKESIGEVGLLDGDADRATLAKGDLLVVEGNGSLEHIGRVALWNDEVQGARHQNHIIRVRPREFASRYLLEWLASPLGRDAIVEEATSAAGLYTLSLSKVERLPIPVPPLPEQRRIVAKLESLQSRSRRAREALEAVPPLLEKLRQSILAAAFRGELTADWRAQHPDVEPASELLKRIRIERRKKWEQAELAKFNAKGKLPTDEKWKQKYVEPEPVDDSELPELPEGWVWARAQDLASNDENAICAGPFGTIFKAKGFRAEGIPIVFLRHVSPGKYLTRKPGFMDRKKWQELFLPYSVYGGELLVTKLGDPPGACAIYPNDIGPAMVTPDVIKMEPDKRLAVATYLMHYLNSDFARRMTFGMSFGTTRLRMTLDIFRDMPVPLAPILEQTELVERVTSEFGRIATTSGSLDSSICEVGRFEQAILYKAFRGELVPQDPSDAIESPPGAPTPGSFATKTKTPAKSQRNS